MTSDLDILNELIQDSAKEVLRPTESGNSSATLTESLTSDSSVTILGLPQESIIIKTDAFDAPNGIFKGKKGECSRADYAVIADTGSKRFIVHIELKKTKDSRAKIIAQLKGSMCFVEYCRKIGTEFWGKRDFLKGYEQRFIAFTHTGSIKKRPTQMSKEVGKHNKPEKMMKINWPRNQQFRKLVGN